ncbi:MAG: hypothetical protein AVDCRST_MAG71-296 [uncultured Lysobacter sp.]|uniref:Uncharacterized protein n=1 Tax=uncultured Lysobacter sp. TaxID=271060 RepID=A0A6J4KF46_9GAMM|nr:MAG: hypothetical protein AVDCRST_MAG71-296 [uncultured Lysobacter sp.]
MLALHTEGGLSRIRTAPHGNHAAAIAADAPRQCSAVDKKRP